jgi:hypothetical protein
MVLSDVQAEGRPRRDFYRQLTRFVVQSMGDARRLLIAGMHESVDERPNVFQRHGEKRNQSLLGRAADPICTV